jgi:hypothetical protein
VGESRAMRSSGRGRGCLHDMRKAALLHTPTAPLSKRDGVAPRVGSQRFVEGLDPGAQCICASFRRRLLAGETPGTSSIMMTRFGR